MLRFLQHKPVQDVTNPFALCHLRAFLVRNGWLIVLAAGGAALLLQRPVRHLVQAVSQTPTSPASITLAPQWDMSTITLRPWPVLEPINQYLPVLAIQTATSGPNRLALFDMRENAVLLEQDADVGLSGLRFSEATGEFLLTESVLPFTSPGSLSQSLGNLRNNEVLLFAALQFGRSVLWGVNPGTRQTRRIGKMSPVFSLTDLDPSGRYGVGVAADPLLDVWTLYSLYSDSFLPVELIDLQTGVVTREPILTCRAYFTTESALLLIRPNEILLYDWQQDRVLDVLVSLQNGPSIRPGQSSGGTLFPSYSIKKIGGGEEILCFWTQVPRTPEGKWSRLRIPLSGSPRSEDLAVEELPNPGNISLYRVSAYSTSPSGDLCFYEDSSAAGPPFIYRVLNVVSGKIIGEFQMPVRTSCAFLDEERIVVGGNSSELTILRIDDLTPDEDGGAP